MRIAMISGTTILRSLWVSSKCLSYKNQFLILYYESNPKNQSSQELLKDDQSLKEEGSQSSFL